MIAWPPPLASSSEFKSDVPQGELKTRLTQIDILIVQGGERSDCGASTERIDITDKLWLDDNGSPVSHFKPATNVRLILDAIGIIFATSVFSQPDVLSSTD